MKMMRTIGAAFVAIAIATLTAYTQVTPQGQSNTSAAAQDNERVTVVGCVVRESDYRRAQDAGKGGLAGSGLGVANEFVLTDAVVGAPAAADAAAATPGTTPGTAGTSGRTAAYELTGPNEKQAEQFVGRRAEISGTLKRAEVGAAGPTGGVTAGEPPRGIDVASRDLKLRELEVTTVRAASGSCAKP